MDPDSFSIQDFKFDFVCEASVIENDDSLNSSSVAVVGEGSASDVATVSNEEHFLSERDKDRIPNIRFHETSISTSNVDSTSSSSSSMTLHRAHSSVAVADDNSSNIVESVYEGGYSLWQCCHDLASYLLNIPNSFLMGKSVLEVGCGHGLPGIVALHQGAASVDFQDYNADVISSVTIPNVLKNSPRSIPLNSPLQSRFFSGDWSLLSSIVPKRSYDIILGSDVTYRPSNFPALITIIQHALSDSTDDSIVLIMTKSYYFGLGGGKNAFVDYCNQNSNSMDLVVENDALLTIQDGKSAVRSLIALRRRHRAMPISRPAS